MLEIRPSIIWPTPSKNIIKVNNDSTDLKAIHIYGQTHLSILL